MKELIYESRCVDMYGVNFVVAIGDCIDTLNKRYKPIDNSFTGLGTTDSCACTYSDVVDKCGVYTVIVWFRNLDYMRSSYIGHECCHAALNIFKWIGAYVDLNNQEPFAYLIGWLNKEVTECYYKWNKEG